MIKEQSKILVQKKPRLLDIDSLTGIAIILVVIGHLEATEYLHIAGMEWYGFTKKFIYSFHMPLFIFLSGFIWSYTTNNIRSINNFLDYIKKKFLRLAPSYFLFALIVFISKLIFSKYFFVNNSVNNINDFFIIFYNPAKGFAGYLWYIYVLFEYYLFVPLILLLLNNKIIIALIISIPLSYVSITSYFEIINFNNYLFFFLLGIFIEKHNDFYINIIDSWKYYFITIFIILCVSWIFIPINKFIMGISSIPALHSFVRTFYNTKSLLSIIGYYSFSIYLIHMLVLGLLKAISFKYLYITYSNFYIFAFFGTIAGVWLPIIIKKNIINNIPIVGRHIG